MRQDPHKFVIDTRWKTATLKNDRKERPMIPIKTISMHRKLTQQETAHVPIILLQEMFWSWN